MLREILSQVTETHTHKNKKQQQSKLSKNIPDKIILKSSENVQNLL